MLNRTHEVVAASGGNQALEIITQERQFDLVLCDLVMSDGDGMVFYGALSGVGPDLRKRVLFMSGGACTPRASEFIGKHEIVVIDKPLRARELLLIVERKIAGLLEADF